MINQELEQDDVHVRVIVDGATVVITVEEEGFVIAEGWGQLKPFVNALLDAALQAFGPPGPEIAFVGTGELSDDAQRTTH